LGDVTGIGPEIALKALRIAASEPAPPGVSSPRFVVLGDAGWIERANRAVGLDLEPLAGAEAGVRVRHFDPRLEPLPPNLPRSAAPAARAAVDWLSPTVREPAWPANLDALLTAPVNKRAIEQAGILRGPD
jgi:4-hydroxy-L-threonine phosphate dehydrogenase PdxA